MPIRIRLALSFVAVTLRPARASAACCSYGHSAAGWRHRSSPGLQTQADALGQSLGAGLQSSEDANGVAIVLRTQDVVTQVLDPTATCSSRPGTPVTHPSIRAG